uniref:FH2 domain-containing protein n=1 Tax=Nothobranchius furzeri TaxID=105023 RepID=A0A8C6KGD1_NOTFU
GGRGVSLQYALMGNRLQHKRLFSACAFPLPDPQDVFLAAQVKFDDLSGDLKQLQQDLSKCEKNVQKVCSDSPEELLQPFKDKMEAFDLVLYFGLKPKPGEKEVTTSHLFMLWFEFCADFKSRWKRENKNISKQRYESARNTNRPLKHLIKIKIFILHKA